MKKEKLLFIDITKEDITHLNRNIFNETVHNFLKDHENVDVKNFSYDVDLAKVYLEVLNNNLSNVKDAFSLYKTFEKIYDYWRNIKRYVLLDSSTSSNFSEDDFLRLFDELNETFLKSYRIICRNLTGSDFNVYRQLPAYANAFVLLDKYELPQYPVLNSARTISRIVFKTPFVSYSASNKREGLFAEIKSNPLDGLDLSKEEWFMFPIMVGKNSAFVYFPKRFMSLGVSLSNLFQYNSSYKTIKPDYIIVFGSNTTNGIYYDKQTDTYIGSLVACDKIDYFGYLKKIILTVHNIKMIKEGKLPIHGAGVSILFKNGTTKNVVLIGDSGAGKSETLEALRELSSESIVDMLTIYDDMGTFFIENNEIYTIGTEIGAFVRTDDLANDYVYKVFDRAIFLNPTGKNARLVLPVSSYQDIISKRKVDIVLYANNYQHSRNKIELFDNLNRAIDVFKSGKRIALQTTSEIGLVESFFANPFGPVQERRIAEPLLNNYLNLLFKNNIPVGQIFTGLALENGKDNPAKSAKALLKLLNE